MKALKRSMAGEYSRELGTRVLMPNIEHRNRFTIKMKDAWLDRGELIPSLANFCDALRRVCIHSNALNRLGSTNKLGDLVATASLV